MINDVQRRIDRITPWMGVLDRLGGRTDERVCSFCIGEARTLAWSSAQELATARESEFPAIVDRQDHIVAGLGKLVRNPGPWVRASLLLVRARETSDVPTVMDALTANS